MYFHETFFAKLRYAIIIVHMSRCCRNINAKCAEHSPSDPRSTCSTLTSSASSTGQCYVALDRHVQEAAPNTVMCICAMHSSEYDTHNNLARARTSWQMRTPSSIMHWLHSWTPPAGYPQHQAGLVLVKGEMLDHPEPQLNIAFKVVLHWYKRVESAF